MDICGYNTYICKVDGSALKDLFWNDFILYSFPFYHIKIDN